MMKVFKSMTDMQSVKIRSLKDGDWYWIGRRVLRLYGRRLGASGVAVYNTLACFADSRTQGCFPTRKAMARILGVSRRTVTRKIKLLEELGLVRIEKARSSFRYFLLAPPAEVTEETCGKGDRDGQEGTNGTPEGDKRDTSEVTPGHTNNNQLTIINNNTAAAKHNFASKGLQPESKERLLALDLAKALNDRRGLKSYLSYARSYPEPFLRRILGEVKEVPEQKIKKGRAALFHYLVRKHAQKTAHNFRN